LGVVRAAVEQAGRGRLRPRTFRITVTAGPATQSAAGLAAPRSEASPHEWTTA
jgi:hypothetical protein